MIGRSLRDELVREGDSFRGCYRLGPAINAGGMGRVYRATHTGTRRRRALKLMRPDLCDDARARERFAREATITAGIKSDHLVEVIDAGVDADTGLPFLVMELLEGADVGELLARRGRLGAEETLSLLAQAASALTKTHAAGIVHRDLKPSNLFVTEAEDGSMRLKILDFGIAKVVAEQAGGDATRVAGTPEYMAPEQLEGQGISPATDVYALAQVAYAMLVGTSYFAREAGGMYATLLRVARGVDEPASVRARAEGVELSEAFDAWFEAATSPRPGERPQPASQAVARLARALGVEVAPQPAQLGAAKEAVAEETTLAPSTAPSLARVPRGRGVERATAKRRGLRWAWGVGLAASAAVGAIALGAGSDAGPAGAPATPIATSSMSGMSSPNATPSASPSPSTSISPTPSTPKPTSIASATARSIVTPTRIATPTAIVTAVAMATVSAAPSTPPPPVLPAAPGPAADPVDERIGF